MSLLRKYAGATLLAVAGKIINAFAAVAVLWLLNIALGKEEFGIFIVFLTFLLLLSSVIGTGLRSLLLYHVSRIDRTEDSEDGRSCAYAGTLLILACVLGGMSAWAVYLAAPLVLFFFDGGRENVWVLPLVTILPFEMAKNVLTSWYQACQEVPRAVIFRDILPNVFRVVLLGVAVLTNAGYSGVVYSHIMAAAVPPVWLFVLQPVFGTNFRSLYSAWDLRYGLKSAVEQLFSQQTQALDILLVATLVSAPVSASYAMANRLSRLLMIAKQSVNQLLLPRIGYHMGRNDEQGLTREFLYAQTFTMAGTLCAGIAFVLLGPWVLSLFGDYQDAYPMLLVLVAAGIVRTGFGSVGGLMSIAGYAGWRLMINAASFGLMLLSFILFVPYLGGTGGALGVLVTVWASFSGMSLFMWQKRHMRTISGQNLAVLGAASAIFCCAALGYVLPLQAAGLLGVLVAWLLFSHRQDAIFLLKYVLGGSRSE